MKIDGPGLCILGKKEHTSFNATLERVYSQ